MLLLHPHGHDYGIDIDENITKNIPSFIATKITREIFRNRNKTIGEVIDKVCDDINNIFSVILIDSPEIALHPQWQRKIIDVYEGIGENSQFIIATNSQYIIDNIELFQGSNVVLERPEVLISGFYKDFGYGFYCTNIEKQAKRWALTKRPKHIINKYIYSENKELQILKFENMTDEWLDFIVSCRRGISHNYDIVEGPMADDTIRNSIEDFVDGTITRAAFWALVKLKYPINQIVFCNDNSLKSLKFQGAYSL